MEIQARVSILGAGAAGLALATDLESRGIHVLVYSHAEHRQHVNAIIKSGHIRVTGAMQTRAQPRFTTDMGLAVGFSRVLILAVPSTGQETLLEELKLFSLHRHAIIAIPGNLFSLVAELDVGCILETNLAPYSCRMNEEELIVLGRKDHLFIAALQQDLSPLLYDIIERILPVELNWCSSVIEVCLLNINGVFHPLMMLMNAGRIESTEGDFLLYHDGLTPSVARAMDAIDQVRIRVGEAFGLQLKSALEVSNECYGHNFTSLVDLARNSGPHNRLGSPANLGHRNISEDVPDLLVCWLSLAEKLGIDASPLKAVVVLAEMATGVKFSRTGRSVEKLNLERFSREELVETFSARRRRIQPSLSPNAFHQPENVILSQL